MKYTLIVVFLCAAAIFKTVESISCYSCSGSAGCGPFNSSLVDAVNCDKFYPETTRCIAYTLSSGNVSVTTRSCAYRPENSNDTLSCDYVRAQDDYNVDSCYTCTSHLCNAAMKFGGDMLGVLAATTVVRIILGKVL